MHGTATDAVYADRQLSQGQIRLLRLEPGSGSDTIKCGLFVASLADRPEFAALSYVWGDLLFRKPIRLCGLAWEVTANLEAALQRVRYENKDRILWVDAICINQEDIEEKSSQIQLMGRIYRESSKTLAWLGPCENSDIVRDLCDENAPGDPARWPSARGHQKDHVYLRSAHSAFENMLQVPWWNRVWTYQEAIIPTKIVLMYGQYDTSLSRIRDFLVSMARANQLAPWSKSLEETVRAASPAFGLLRQRLAFEYLPSTTLALEEDDEHAKMVREYIRSFPSYMKRQRHRECSNSLDRIYGILGLIPACLYPSLPPDYSASFATVAQELTWRFMTWTRQLDILSMKDFETPHEELPTWAFNFDASTDLRYETMLEHRISRINGISASKDRYEIVELHPQGVLGVTGCVCGYIESVSEVDQGLNSSLDFVRNWWSICDRHSVKPLHRQQPKHLKDIFQEVILHAWIEATDDHWLFRWASKHYFRRKFLSDVKLDSTIPQKALELVMRRLSRHKGFQEPLAEMDNAVHIATYRRRLFISDTGVLGLAPADAQPGDKICILFGGSVPYILRESGREAEVDGVKHPCHAFVGDSYVHGLMYGEAIDMMERNEIQKERFFLV